MKDDTWAEDLAYWKTSQSMPDTWLDRTIGLIEKAGGVVEASGYGNQGERSAYMVTFGLDGEVFRIVWPVIPSKTGNVRAAKVQAATMMHHDVKARLISAQVLGVRAAFFNWLMLPDGRTATSVGLAELVPPMLMAG